MKRSAFRLVCRILANDLRLYFRSWQRKGRHLAVTLLIQLAIIGALHVQMPIIFGQVAKIGGALGGAGLACAFVVLFTVGSGLSRSVEVLYNRGDLPYLLSSPVPARIVIITRVVDILVTTSLTSVLLMLPMLNTAVYLFGKHWLWGWPAWLMSITILAPLALLTTILLVKWAGARGARTIVQILAILTGVAALLMMQAPNLMRQLPYHPEQRKLVQQYFAFFETPPLPQLVAAASGHVGWLLVLAALGGGCVAVAFRVLEREFIAGAQGTAADVGGKTRRTRDSTAIQRAWQRAFRTSRWSVLVRKELRTLLRDPLLIVRSSTQLISFIPALIGLFWAPRGVAIGSLAMAVPSLMAISTASLMSATDESLELLCSSPVSRVQSMWARTLAAAFPSLLLAVVGAAALLAMGLPYLALATALGSSFLTIAHAWLGGCTAPRQTADDRAANRPVRSTWQVFVSMIVSGFGAGAIAAPAMGAPLFVAIPLGALAVLGGGLMFIAQPRPIWAE